MDDVLCSNEKCRWNRVLYNDYKVCHLGRPVVLYSTSDHMADYILVCADFAKDIGENKKDERDKNGLYPGQLKGVG